LVIYCLGNNICDSIGDIPDLWFLSVNLFTIIIVVVSNNILIIQKTWTWVNVIFMIVTTYLFYIFFVLFVNGSTLFNSTATMPTAFGSPVFWMVLIQVSGICFLLDTLTYSYHINFSNHLTENLRILVNQKGVIDLDCELPYVVEHYMKKYINFKNNKQTNMIVDDSIDKKKETLHSKTNKGAQGQLGDNIESSFNETKKNLKNEPEKIRFSDNDVNRINDNNSRDETHEKIKKKQ